MLGLRLDRLEVVGVCPSLSLDVRAGEVRAAIVPDQQAVHSLANTVVGLDEPDDGRVLVDNAAVAGQHSDHRHHRRHRAGRRSRHCRIRLVPASGGLVPELTVLDNIVNAQCPTARAPREQADRMVDDAVESFGLDPLLDRRPEHLTPGERRLAGLALALCWEPSAVVLEDAAGLPTWDAVLAEQRRRQTLEPEVEPFAGVAVLLITTDAARAWQLDGDPVGLEPGDRR
jgi:ABC-type transporter Mla maintaining outer membrane lipid asymmetry ATPase subunit MlaF